MAVRVRPPERPSTVKVYVPAAVDAPALIVSVELDVAGLGPKEKVAPSGSPVALRLTGDEKPPDAAIVTAYETLLPCSTVCEAGATERPKSGVGGAGADVMASIR